MEEKNKKLLGDVVTSALFIIAGIVIAVVTSNTIVRVCGVAVAVIEIISVIRQFVKWRTGGGNKE